MRTPPMPDEELDEAVRRSAEAYPNEVPLGSWLRMEDRLNEALIQEQVRQRVNRRVGRLVGIVLLLALTLLWWPHQLLEPHRPPARIQAGVPAGKETLRRNPDGVWTSASSGSASAIHSPKPATALVATAPVAVASTAFRPLSKAAPEQASEARLPRRLITSVRRPGFRWPLLAPSKENLTAAPATGYTLQTLSGEQQAERSTAGQTPSTRPPSAPVLPDPASLAEPPVATSAGPPAPDTTAAATSEAASPSLPPFTASDSARIRKGPARPAYRLLVGVVAAPELTAVHLSSLHRPGTTAGVVVEYQLTRRLRVRTGLQHSVKLYSARGSDYRPPASYWTWRIPVDAIEADCRILEIPLDMRYGVVLGPRYVLFASAGLSSFVMRNETYTYKYAFSGQYVERTWSYPRGGQHLLRVLSLSVGYERAMGMRWAVQAEPFVKLPLGGIGFGSIPLRSAGIAFGLKYALFPTQPVALSP